GDFLDAEKVEASFELMGVDTSLIIDGTYFVIEQEKKIVGCGGWSRRAPPFCGDHTSGRDAPPLRPVTQPAPGRAQYTHPDFARQGIARLLLELCEAAAKKEGFCSLELMATVAGEPLYLAYGFNAGERTQIPTSKGIQIPLTRMTKLIDVAC